MSKNVIYDFTGEVALVTGGGSGIGEAISVRFAQAGAQVLICDFDEKKGSQLAETLTQAGHKAAYYKVDVSDPAACVALKDLVMEKYGKVDILINNAGVSPGWDPETGRLYFGPPLDFIAYGDWERQFKINLMGAVNMCVAFRQVFVDQKFGKVVMTSSINAYRPSPLEPQYGSMKLALIYFAQCFAKEMGEYNINVNAFCPGWVLTPMYEAGNLSFKDVLPALKDVQTTKEMVDKLGVLNAALKRPQTPDDMADGVLFLSSDAAREITGQVLIIDSGAVFR